MKSVWAVLFALLISVTFAVTLPEYALASGPLDGPLVPACEASLNGNFIGACQLCDLVKLARNLINFAIAFSVIAATLLFAYAGFMYFTAASSPENIKKAHGIFTKTLGGIVIILVAWLVVDILMQTITGGTWGLSRDIQCMSYPEGAALPTRVLEGSGVTGSGTTGGTGRCANTPGRPSTPDQETAARTALEAPAATVGGRAERPVTINNPNACSAGQTTGCTSVGGLTQQTISYIRRVAGAYPGCTLRITGGSEGGHCEHNRGVAFDLGFGDCSALDTAVAGMPAFGGGKLGVRSTEGARWVRETSPSHWHVCAAGANC